MPSAFECWAIVTPSALAGFSPSPPKPLPRETLRPSPHSPAPCSPTLCLPVLLAAVFKREQRTWGRHRPPSTAPTALRAGALWRPHPARAVTSVRFATGHVAWFSERPVQKETALPWGVNNLGLTDSSEPTREDGCCGERRAWRDLTAGQIKLIIREVLDGSGARHLSERCLPSASSKEVGTDEMVPVLHPQAPRLQEAKGQGQCGVF